ncbi:putative MFS family arabinose efflux permease [Kitasatospora sp. SolWspMP-SS2h]|uniref:MFS transporter n=1 Tax=Kitasatospora sp. SolWspMP-SS2h TaxID=1305729 RepID=UPI000DC05308|nr:MFS transporter [Kitasatospora sp. SolWspMP-SS2h]RAJ41835.1 putative MFS family arabinose efflux permease [Kitasatospora sp. SolWspMP-SS2h]
MKLRSPEQLGRAFNLFWFGKSVSNVGDRVTVFVVPTLMIFVLHASAFQVGVVAMAQYLGIPLLGPVAGVLVDRWDKRRTLIACDLVRLAAVAVIPVAYWLDVLSTPLLFCCVAAVSGATIFFNVGYLVAVPAVVEQPHLVRAYSRLEGSGSVAEVSGPSIAAALYAALGAASLLVDAASYLVSAVCFRWMRPWGQPTVARGSVWQRLTLGFRLNWQDPVLRRVVLAAVTLNSGGPVFVTVMPVLAYRGLGVSVGVYGAAMSTAAVGALLGALVAPKIGERFGIGRTLAWALLLHCLVGLGVLAAPALPSGPVIAATMGCYGFFMSCINVCSAPARQSRMSAQHQGVMHAAFRTATWGVIPLAALAGGLAVSLLTGPLGVLEAARWTMVGGTLLAACSFLPALGIQSRMDADLPKAVDRIAGLAEDGGPAEGAGPAGAGGPAEPAEVVK